MSMINWIASYPRSGSTWIRTILASYLLDAPLERAFNEIQNNCS